MSTTNAKALASHTGSIPLTPELFHGAVSLQTTEQGVHPWRLPFDQVGLFDATLAARAADGAGVRLTLVSDTRTLRLRVALDKSRTVDCRAEWSFDLLVDGQRRQRVSAPAGTPDVAFDNIPTGEHRLEIYLPQRHDVWVQSVTLDAGATARPFVDTRPKWVVYGSSITQCAEAAGPSETWPAIVANRFNLNLTCLGFGGQCHLDPMIARTIRDLPADYISLCLGINVQGGATLGPRTFKPAIVGLIKTIRDKHPRTPIVCVSPIFSLNREETPNAVGFSLKIMREHVRSVIDALRAHGDERLVYVDGREMFGPEYDARMPDHLHPDAEGYRLLAQRYGDIAMPALGLRG